MGPALVSCSHESGEPDRTTAQLVETYEIFTGDNQAVFEFTQTNNTYSDVVKHEYGGPDENEYTIGSLTKIYEAVTERPPETPNEYQTSDSILPVLTEHGWVVIEDETRDNPESDAVQSKISTIKLRLNNSG